MNWISNVWNGNMNWHSDVCIRQRVKRAILDQGVGGAGMMSPKQLWMTVTLMLTGKDWS